MTVRDPAPQKTAFGHWCREKLRNIDTDQFHHVNNAVIATLFEAGRMELFGQEAVKPLLAGAHPAVVRLLVNFHHEVFYPGEVSIGTRVTAVGSRSVQITQGLFDGEGCAASAEVVCVFVDPASARAIAIGDMLRAQLLTSGAPVCP